MSTPASKWIDAQIDRALGRAFDQIDAYQRDGYCTQQDVTEALHRGWGEGVAEAWSEYVGEES